VLAALDDRGLAALAIKLNRYLEGQAALAARSEEVHRTLVSVVLEGGDLADLAAELAGLLGGPVLVTTPDGRVVAQAGDAEHLAEIFASPAFDRSGRFRVESGRAVPPGPGHMAEVSIVAGRVDHGRILLFSRSPIPDPDVRSLERAATVAALAVTKGLAVAAVEGKYRADFLRDLLTGRVEDLAAAVAHASFLGWDVDRSMVVAVAELDPGQVPASVSGLDLRPVQERFAAAWQTVLRVLDPLSPVASFHNEVVVVLGVAADQDVDRLVAELDRQVAGDRGGGRLSFSLGVSRIAGQAAELPRAYEQARTAVRIGRRLQGPGARVTFDRLGAYRLLALIPDSDELRGYVGDVLGSLADDTAEANDLRRTLEVLIDANGNVAEAARRLHFHYNTLRYRIEKLEKMVGPFMTQAALRLDLSLALRVRQMRTAVAW
jgi:purine catabolism regulator